MDFLPCHQMGFKPPTLCESLVIMAALIGPFLYVDSHMDYNMSIECDGFVTLDALTCVFPVVCS